MAEKSKLARIAVSDSSSSPMPKSPVSGNGSCDCYQNETIVHIYGFTIKKEPGSQYRIETEKVHYSGGDFFRISLKETNEETGQLKRTTYFHKQIPVISPSQN